MGERIVKHGKFYFRLRSVTSSKSMSEDKCRSKPYVHPLTIAEIDPIIENNVWRNNCFR